MGLALALLVGSTHHVLGRWHHGLIGGPQVACARPRAGREQGTDDSKAQGCRNASTIKTDRGRRIAQIRNGPKGSLHPGRLHVGQRTNPTNDLSENDQGAGTSSGCRADPRTYIFREWVLLLNRQGASNASRDQWQRRATEATAPSHTH